MGLIGLLQAFVLLLLISVGAAWWLGRAWGTPSQLREWGRHSALSVLSLAWIFLFCEFALFLFGARSTDFGAMLSYHRWNAKYWKPLNSLGFRDEEHTAASLRGKKLLVVVGDSFAAGHGIESVQKRFSNRLGELMGPTWVVANVARRGWNTRDEIEALENYPFRPDAVLLSYFINDIEGDACEVPAWSPRLPAPWLFDRSYVLNAVYWRLYRLRITNRGAVYLDALGRCYDDPEIRHGHARTLRRFIAAGRARGAEVGAVAFPHLVVRERTASWSARVVQLLQEQDVFVLDLGPVVQARGRETLAVSEADSHPSEAFHNEVAEQLYERWARGL